jgi:hypothetical protein
MFKPRRVGKVEGEGERERERERERKRKKKRKRIFANCSLRRAHPQNMYSLWPLAVILPYDACLSQVLSLHVHFSYLLLL